ncbi:MAG: FMN-binding protein [Planctomycetota bacterium]|jgi:RnfABCDGE-type electron transport complex G subunit
MSNPYLRFPLVLFLVAAIAGGVLFATYTQTKGAIAAQEAKARIQALDKVFLTGYGATEDVKDQDGTLLYTRVWKGDDRSDKPDYFAVMGAGVGYNTAVPIELLAGFANPEKTGTPSAKPVLVGWSVTKSEETPGLGEKIKESKAAYTISQLISHSIPKPSKDTRTDFQRQFADPATHRAYTADQLVLKKNGGPIDIITGATYTSVGVIKAIQNANERLKKSLQSAE